MKRIQRMCPVSSALACWRLAHRSACTEKTDARQPNGSDHGFRNIPASSPSRQRGQHGPQLHQQGRTDETVEVKVAQKPEGWKTKIKTYRYIGDRVYVPARTRQA